MNRIMVTKCNVDIRYENHSMYELGSQQVVSIHGPRRVMVDLEFELLCASDEELNQIARSRSTGSIANLVPIFVESLNKVQSLNILIDLLKTHDLTKVVTTLLGDMPKEYRDIERDKLIAELAL